MSPREPSVIAGQNTGMPFYIQTHTIENHTLKAKILSDATRNLTKQQKNPPPKKTTKNNTQKQQQQQHKTTTTNKQQL